MAEFYLDLETNASKLPNLENDEILTIQYQRLNSETGEKESELTTLKSWESSEKDILKEFHSQFSPDEPFRFVPIGMNLAFDLFSLHYRWKRIGIEVPLKTLLYDHPYLDIKPILVILNKGSFKGASLGKFIGFPEKEDLRAKIPGWYENKDYAKIEEYLRKEADGFIQLYQNIKRDLPHLLR